MMCPSGEKRGERERDSVTTGDDDVLILLSALVQVALSESKLTDRLEEEEGLVIRKE